MEAALKAARLVELEESNVVSTPRMIDYEYFITANIIADETRPVCKRCSKAGFDCEGYAGIKFIDFRPSNAQHHRKSTPDSLSSASVSCDLKHVPGLINKFATRLTSLEKSSSSSVSIDSHHTLELTSDFPKSSNRLATIVDPRLQHAAIDRYHIYVSFTRDNFLSNGPIADALTTWLISPRHLRAFESPVLERSLVSLCAAFFGRWYNQRSVLEEGAQLYGSALTEVNRAIADDRLSKSSQLIASVTSLAVFEVSVKNKKPTYTRMVEFEAKFYKSFLPLSKHAWAEHIEGLEHLYSHRGGLLAGDPARELLQVVRPNMLLRAYLMSQRTILSEPQWSSVAYNEHFHPLLMDLLAKVIDLRAFKNELVREGTIFKDESAAHEFWLQAGEALRSIQQWRQEWDVENPSAYWTQSPKLLIGTHFLYKWNEAIHFSSISVSDAMMLHSAITISFWEEVLPLLNHPNVAQKSNCTPEAGGDQPKLTSFSKAEIRQSIGEMVTFICLSLDYKLQNHHKGWKTFATFFPIRVARGSLGHESDTGQWLERVFCIMKQGMNPGPRVWSESLGKTENIGSSRDDQFEELSSLRTSTKA